MAGNRLEVSIAVFIDTVYAEKLLSLDLCLGLHGPDNILRVVRTFVATKKCIDQLRTMYGELVSLPKIQIGRHVEPGLTYYDAKPRQRDI